MPKIISTYSPGNSSLGDSLSALGATMWGPQALQAGMVREKTRGLARENDNLPLAAAAAASGDYEGAIRHGILGGLKGDDVANFGRYRTYSDPAVPFGGEAQTRATMGAGGAFGSTAAGYRLGQDTELQKAQISAEKAANAERYKADQTPFTYLDTNSPYGFSTTTRSRGLEQGFTEAPATNIVQGVAGAKVLADPTGQPESIRKLGNALPADDKMMNWQALGPDGRVLQGRVGPNGTDAATGQPLPPNARFVSPANAGPAMGPLAPDNTEQRNIRGKLTANQELLEITQAIEQRITADPTIVGPLGQGQKLAQNTVSLATDITNALGKGKTVDESLLNIRQDAISKYGAGIAAVLPELFKPAINEIEVLHGLMIYKTAAALAGQEGRDLSDRDVAAARKMAGDPTSWFTSSQEQLGKLGMIRNLATANAARYNSMLTQQNVTAGGGTPPAAPAPAAPAVPAAGADGWSIQQIGP
jgi:hypothetical protein